MHEEEEPPVDTFCPPANSKLVREREEGKERGRRRGRGKEKERERTNNIDVLLIGISSLHVLRLGTNCFTLSPLLIFTSPLKW